jgi:hypothetical protein
LELLKKLNPFLRSQNVSNSSKKNDNGFQYEEFYHEIVDVMKPGEVKVFKSFVFFENNIGISLQHHAEKSKFQSELLDFSAKTAKFYEPIIVKFDSSETKTFSNDSFGYEFKYPENLRVEEGFSLGLPQVNLSKLGSKTYGTISVEFVDPYLNFDFQKYFTSSFDVKIIMNESIPRTSKTNEIT